MEWWSQFVDLFANNEYFRYGFIWGLFVAFLIWVVFVLLNWLQAQWLKMRQFFEPTKKPGKVPVETGPSPANIMLGCMWRIIFTAVAAALVIAILVWWMNGISG